jgi:hypothetical protein
MPVSTQRLSLTCCGRNHYNPLLAAAAGTLDENYSYTLVVTISFGLFRCIYGTPHHVPIACATGDGRIPAVHD